MVNEKDTERLEAADLTCSMDDDSAVAEASAGMADLVEQQRTYVQYLKDGGRSGCSGDFGKPEFVCGEALIGTGGGGGAGANEPDAGGRGSGGTDRNPPPPAAYKVYEGQGASGTAFVGDTEQLAERILEKLEEAQDEDTSEQRAKELRAEVHELLKSVKTKEEMDALQEELEDEDTFGDIDFEAEINSDGDVVWWFRGDDAIDVLQPEEVLEKEQEKSEADSEGETEGDDPKSRTLKSADFDELGEDVAKALRDMGVQRIDITDLGDGKKHVKLKLKDDHEIATGNDWVTSVELAEEVEMDIHAGDDGKLKITEIEGISGNVAGTPLGVGVNELEVSTNEAGEHVARVSTSVTDREMVLPEEVHSRLLAVLGKLK